MVEHRTVNAAVAGSNPAIRAILRLMSQTLARLASHVSCRRAVPALPVVSQARGSE